MKVQEFVDFMKKNTNRTMKEEQISSLVKRTLEVKSYLSIKEKKQLVEEIIEDSILYENGIFKFDNIQKYICFTMFTLVAYTNLELSDDIEDDFDLLSESKLLPILVCIIQQEYDDINLLLEMQCDYILVDNTIEAQFGKLLNGVLEKVDGIEQFLKSYLSNVDVKSLLKDKDKLFELLSKIK